MTVVKPQPRPLGRARFLRVLGWSGKEPLSW